MQSCVGKGPSSALTLWRAARSAATPAPCHRSHPAPCLSTCWTLGFRPRRTWPGPVALGKPRVSSCPGPSPVRGLGSPRSPGAGDRHLLQGPPGLAQVGEPWQDITAQKPEPRAPPPARSHTTYTHSSPHPPACPHRVHMPTWAPAGAAPPGDSPTCLAPHPRPIGAWSRAGTRAVAAHEPAEKFPLQQQAVASGGSGRRGGHHSGARWPWVPCALPLTRAAWPNGGGGGLSAQDASCTFFRPEKRTGGHGHPEAGLPAAGRGLPGPAGRPQPSTHRAEQSGRSPDNTHF